MLAILQVDRECLRCHCSKYFKVRDGLPDSKGSLSNPVAASAIAKQGSREGDRQEETWPI